MKLTEEQIQRVRLLEDEQGRLTPDAVLADAKRKDSPLHALFDWDAKKAAHQWWIECAREIIRTVKVVVTTTEVTLKAPVYVRDPDATGQGYRSIVALQREPESAREALREELRRAAGVVTRARHLALALNLADEVDAMLSQIVGLQARLDDPALVESAVA